MPLLANVTAQKRFMLLMSCVKQRIKIQLLSLKVKRPAADGQKTSFAGMLHMLQGQRIMLVLAQMLASTIKEDKACLL